MRILDFSDGFESNVQPTAFDASDISVTPAGDISSTDLQSALEELDSEKVPKVASTDNTIPRFDGTDGDIQSSGITVDDSNNVSGVKNLTADGTTQNLGTSNSDSTVNIATGTGANVVNIGGANTQVNITGTVETQNVTNMDVSDKLITINKGGSAASGAVSGLSIEEGSTETGYMKTSAGRDALEIKAPGTAGVASIKPGSSNDEVALLAKAQTLSSKTFSDAPTFTQISTPSNPASGYNKIYPKSDGKFYTLNSSGLEVQVGSGSGGGAKNYLGNINGTNNNGDFETGSVGSFVLGNASLTSNFPSGTPTFGSGASGNLAGSVVSSGQLAGSYSYSYASSAATTAGDFLASPAFTIDLEDQAKVMAFKFYYKAQTNPSNANWSGTSSNSFGVAIYDVTNSTWIMPAGVWNLVQSSGVGISTGTFQTTSNSTQYRLCVFNANATSGAVTVYFDDFFLGPQVTAIAPAMSDWVAYTPTFTGFGTPTNVSFYSRRVGDSLEVHGHFNSGTPTAVTSKITLGYNGVNANVTIDTSKINNGNQIVGSATVGTASTTKFTWTAVSTGANNYIGLGAQTSTGGGNGPGLGTNVVNVSGDQVEVFFSVPIVGWSSNTVSSADTDTRVVALTTPGQLPTGTISSGYNVVKFGSVGSDSAGSYSTSTGLYTCSVSGFYTLSTVVEVTATYTSGQRSIISLQKNGGSTGTGTGLGAGVWTAPASFTGIQSISAHGGVYCNAGDTLGVYFLTNGTSVSYTNASTASNILVQRLSGPAVVQATENINARYHSATASLSSSFSKITYSTKDIDSHAAYSSGNYTVPVAGSYLVSAQALMQATFAVGNYVGIAIYKNGVSYAENYFTSTTATSISFDIQITDLVPCNAGDVITIQGVNSGTTPVITASTVRNKMSIRRTGN